MDKYIKKDTIIVKINEFTEKYIAEGQNARAKTSAMIGKYIREIPDEDVQPVRHGKWVRINRWYLNPLTGTDGVYIGCSNCRAPIPTDSLLDYLDQSECAFCYSCGAKMEEE